VDVKNEKVSHQKYGAGVVTQQNTGTVTVDFGGEHGEKKFLYPAAFESFLSLESAEAQGEVASELRRLREERDAERLARDEELKLRLDAEKRFALQQKKAAQKRTAAKKTPSAPKKTASVKEIRNTSEEPVK
jgi:hypothetical protein